MLKEILIQALDGNARAINRLYDQMQRMAVAYIRTKAHSYNFLLSQLYKNIDDLALDCIAELFDREKNCLVSIETYFSQYDISQLKESEVQSKLRQLVFSKINDGLYQNYKKLDPSLSRIIRNLKRTLDEEKVEGAKYDASTGEIITEADESNLPKMPDEILEVKLSSKLSGINNSIDSIEALATILTESEEYASKVKLVNYAIILRKTSAHQFDTEEKTTVLIAGEDHDKEQLHKILRQCITNEKDALLKTYVHSGKICMHQFSKYVLAVEDILKADYIFQLPREGYFEHVEYYMPELDYTRYRAEHRQVVEYMVRKVRQQFIAEVKMAEIFSNRR